ARTAHERLPVAVRSRHHPRVLGARKLRQVLLYNVADRVDVERPAEPLAEENQALHLGHPRFGLDGLGFRRRVTSLRLLALAQLMEGEYDDEDDQRRYEREARAPLRVSRESE